ncbi:hypothetical protein PIROE2DRAFT_4965, partial [Piromyces sp. E2]
MKRISKKLFNYTSTKKNQENNDFKNNITAVKKQSEEEYEDISENPQDTEQISEINEQENITSNNNIQNNIASKYQSHEQNLEFGIIQCSSNYGEFSPYELSANDIDKNYKSWISSKNCQYPQYVTLKLINGTCYINTLQILFHQLFIPSKVEIFLGNLVKIPNLENSIGNKNFEKLIKSCVAVEFERIGYFTLYNNQEVDNTARELKSITINKKAHYIKLVIYECYKNDANIDNQVMRVNGTPQSIEKYDESEDNSVQNKMNKNNNVISNTTIKKSENITTKQKSMLTKRTSDDNDNDYNKYNNSDNNNYNNNKEDMVLLNENSFEKIKASNKLSKEDLESVSYGSKSRYEDDSEDDVDNNNNNNNNINNINNNNNSDDDDDNDNGNNYNNASRRKNIKPNNLTMVSNDGVNILNKNNMRKTNNNVDSNQEINIIQDEEKEMENDENENSYSSSVMSVSILSASNIVDNNGESEEKKINRIPNININDSNSKVNVNVDNNNNNNNDIVKNNSSNNISSNNTSNSNLKRNNSNIYDEIDNELNQMIRDSSLESLRNENRDKKQTKRENDKSNENLMYRNNSMDEREISINIEKGNIINAFDQATKYNTKNMLRADSHKLKNKYHKETELGKYINALELAKRKAIRNGKNEFAKVVNTLLIIFNESQNKINKMSGLRIQAINDENMDEAENIKANIDYIKDIAINNLKKNSELIVEQSQDNQDIYIYENEEFENELEEERSFSVYSSNRYYSYSNIDDSRRENRSRSSLLRSGTSSKKGSYHDLMSKGKGPYEGSENDNNIDILNSLDNHINNNGNPLRSREIKNLIMTPKNDGDDKQNIKIKEGNDTYDDNERPDEKKLEPLHKNIVSNYELPISIFSEFVIRSLFSLRFQYKEWALKHILYQLKINHDKWSSGIMKRKGSDAMKSTKEEYVMASIQVLKYSILDSREKIISISMDLLLLISSIVKSVELSALLFNEMDFLTSQMFIKSADINRRIRECTFNTFMKMAFFFHTKPYSILPYLFRPFNTSIKAPSKKELRINNNDSVILIPWRYAVSRLQLLLDIIKKYGISSINDIRKDDENGLKFDNVMKFVIPFFSHQNGKVRNIASSLVAEVSVEVGSNNDEFYSYIKDLNPQILNTIKTKSKSIKTEKNGFKY